MTPTACPTSPKSSADAPETTPRSERAAMISDDAMASFRLRSAAIESPDAAHTTSLAVERAKAGDREALRFLYVRYANNIYSYVASLLRNHHEAEDVTQQVFAKLPDSLQRYEDRGASAAGRSRRCGRGARASSGTERRGPRSAEGCRAASRTRAA